MLEKLEKYEIASKYKTLHYILCNCFNFIFINILQKMFWLKENPVKYSGLICTEIYLFQR